MMVEILHVLNWLLPMLYLVLLIHYGAAFFLRTKTHQPSKALPAVLIVHAGYLALLATQLHRIAPVNSLEVLTVVAAAITAVYWVIEFASRDRRTGLFVMLAAFLLQYTSSVFISHADWSGGEVPVGRGSLAQFHTIPSTLAYTAFTLAAIYGALYLMAQRSIKQRHFGLLFDRLPPLELLGTMNWHALLTGFAFISLAILSGAVVAAPGSMTAMSGKVLVKVVTGAAAWVIYAGAIVGRLVLKWESARVSWVAIAGFVVVMAMLVAGVVMS